MLGAPAYAAIAVFVAAYVLFVVRERHQLLISGAAALAVLGLGLVSVSSLLPTGWSGRGGVVEWDTLGLLLGLFLFAGTLRELGLFRRIARRLAQRLSGRPLGMFLSLSVATFVLSAFLNSISVLLVVATVTLELASEAGLDPVPLLLAEVAASNAGGAATFVGDPPNVILGTYFQLSFGDFLLHTGLPALAALAVILVVFSRTVRSASPPPPPTAIEEREAPEAQWGVALALAGFVGMLVVLAVQGPLGVPIWAIGLAGGALALVLAGRTHAPNVLRHLDWPTLVFFVFLFVLVGALVQTGVIGSLAGGITSAGGGNLLLTGSLLLWSLGLLSSLVNNVPLAAAAAPLIAAIGTGSGLPVRPLVWATALGTDLGGSGTPIGASANVVGLAVYRKAGITVSWRQYVRTAFPVMLATLAAANLVWLVLR
jgi:Na+/H+ antiporter NhaD/arsenite permease-like protein